MRNVSLTRLFAVVVVAVVAVVAVVPTDTYAVLKIYLREKCGLSPIEGEEREASHGGSECILSCLLSLVSCLLSFVSCFLSLVSCLLSLVSCLFALVSCLLSLVSLLFALVSFLDQYCWGAYRRMENGKLKHVHFSCFTFPHFFRVIHIVVHIVVVHIVVVHIVVVHIVVVQCCRGAH